MDIEAARQLALSFPGTVEMDHFDIPSFRVNKRIFATLWVKQNRMMVKLSPIDQSVFNAFDPTVFFPVPNKWGLKGATFVELAKVRHDMLQDALNIAYEAVVSKVSKDRKTESPEVSKVRKTESLKIKNPKSNIRNSISPFTFHQRQLKIKGSPFTQLAFNANSPFVVMDDLG